MRARHVHEPSSADPLRSMRALVAHRFLLRVALAGVHVYAWIFVFQYFYLVESNVAHALVRTALLYALSHIIVCLLTPYAARHLRGGARRLLFLGTAIAALGFISLGTVFIGLWDAAYGAEGVVGFAIAIGLYRALYWVPYATEAVVHMRKNISVFSELLVAFSPLIAGLFIAGVKMGPVWILYIGAMLIVLSMLPLFFLRDLHERFSWKYRETFVQLFERKNRSLVLEAFLEGISGTALLLFWPLAVFLLVGWSYGMLGIVLTLTFWVAILMRGVIRKQLRRLRLAHSATLEVLLAVTPWLFRLVVATPLGVIFVDSFFYTTTPRRIGVDPFVFEQAADGGSYVDEFTALKEIALALGRIALCILGAAAATFVSVPTALVSVFLAAALAAAAGAFWLRSN